MLKRLRLLTLQPRTSKKYPFLNTVLPQLVISTLTIFITSVAKILQWGGGLENDITFNHTLYTEADPESFGGVDVILNQFQC